MKKKKNKMEEKFKFFWKGELSQWYPSVFILENQEFNCAEQYMMWKKAIIFKDYETAGLISYAKHPREQKKLGREVKNFIQEEWNEIAKKVVYDGNYAKFKQNPDLMNILLNTDGFTLVEASPYDSIWGIGMKDDNPNALNRKTWNGLNWLGEVLTTLRDDILTENMFKKINNILGI